MKTTRVSIKSGKPYDVYIGRPSKYANIFTNKESKFDVIKTESRKESIERFREYLRNNTQLQKDIEELRGKVIACWCDENQSCHGDVIIEFLNKRKLF